MNENSRISGLGWTCESSPDVSLSMARERRDAVRRLVADGKDPSAERPNRKEGAEAHGQALEQPIVNTLSACLDELR